MRWWLAAWLVALGCSRAQPVATTGGTPQPTPGPSRSATNPVRWLIFGDSITQNSFHDTKAWDAAWGPQAPSLVGFGLRGADSAYALTQEDELLARYPGPGALGLAFGTNDAGHLRTPEAFKASLLAMADHARAAGRWPVLVATIPYSPHPNYQTIPRFNQAIAESGLPAGPDLYAWFQQHPDQISGDQIHPTDEGNTAVQRLWAMAAMANGF
jgi:lysophospholipase L1-like esterase